MPCTAAPRFRKHLIALAAGAALAPHGAWALDLATAPPGTVEPFVRPNVILSLDDSTSMNTGMNDANGNYLGTRREVLKKAVKETFSDSNLLPDGKIRLAWQSMNECTRLDGVGAGDLLEATDTTATTGTKMNLMRVYEGTHRSNFMRYIDAYRTRSQSGWSCQSGTFTHSLVKAADSYMRASTHKNGPWSSNPGGSNDASTEYLGCRRNYHIVLTDGEWNSGMTNVPGTQKNYDGSRSYWPSNIPTATDAQTQLYRDRSETYSSIADWAFYSWANPLKADSDLEGTIQPSKEYRIAPATETFENRVSKTKATLDRFWNPRYNPATWPHLVTFTIGFSVDALPETNYKWNGSSHVSDGAITKPTSLVPYGYDGNFADYANGTYRWRASSDKGHDMWHAAINGRGQFYAVEKGEDLKKAFQAIIGNINTATDPDLSASATSGSNVSRSEVGKYTASYEPLKAWKGSVTADRVKPDGTTTPDTGWGGKNTADKLDALSSISNRLVLSWSDKWNSSAPKGGVSFKWASDETYLSVAQKLWLQTNPDGTAGGATKGEQRLNYIRGDRSMEGVDPSGYTTSKPYRQRHSRQGDIINSDVWYTGAPSADYLLKGYTAFVRDNATRPGMLYVGGNDGMLHGFAAADGQEKLAYVPRGVLSKLTHLTDPAYNESHKYFVDGSPMTGDVDLNGGIQNPNDPNYGSYTANWRTLLVGTLGLGGKGYFVLDVTNPSSFTEANANTLVTMDRTRGSIESAPNCDAMSDGAEKDACLVTVQEDADIGHITAKPVVHENDVMRSTQITRMNNNRWAVIMGNGYNSTNQRPVLLIQYLDGDKSLLRIPAAGTLTTIPDTGTGLSADNGLSAPRVVDLNGDNRADIVYAGDNLGNMWKFDLTSINASNWKVAFGGSPLFTASGPTALNGTTRPKVQPISAPPTVRANDRTKMSGTGSSAKEVPVGGMMVAFGTGRNISRTDPESVDVQTLYSVLDNTRYNETGTGENKRLEVHPGGSGGIPVPTALGAGVSTAKLAQQQFVEIDSEFRYIKPANDANELKISTWANFNGWYLDLPSVGERKLKSMQFYDASNILTVWSQVPAKGSDVDPNVESCESSSVDEERQYRTMVNVMDGKAPSVALVDKNNDGQYNLASGDGVMINGKYISISSKKVTKGPHAIIQTSKHQSVDIDAKNNQEKLARMPEESLRPSWRQIQ
jgi:type IV pilus assembly protein PilY1